MIIIIIGSRFSGFYRVPLGSRFSGFCRVPGPGFPVCHVALAVTGAIRATSKQKMAPLTLLLFKSFQGSVA